MSGDTVFDTVRETLAEYLRGVLTPDVTVFDEWPVPGYTLPPKAVAIATGGEFADMAEWSAVDDDTTLTDPDDPTSAVVQLTRGEWRVAIQVDLLAESPKALGQLHRAVVAAVKNTHPADTLGTDAEPRLAGHPVLELATDAASVMLGRTIGYDLPGEPARNPTGTAVQQARWRESWQGWADGFFAEETSGVAIGEIRADFGGGDVASTED